MMMTRIVSVTALTLCGLVLAACAPVPPAPSGPVSAPPPVSAPEPEPPEAEEEQPPIGSGESREPSPAVQTLLDRGWEAHRRDDFRGALTYAERAQRIDARSPEVYLLMATAQFSLYRLNVAEQLVRRGLAFSAEGSGVYRQLQTLMSRITASAR